MKVSAHFTKKSEDDQIFSEDNRRFEKTFEEYSKTFRSYTKKVSDKHDITGCDFVWILAVVYFPVKQSFL